MGAISHSIAAGANQGTAKHCGKDRKGLRLTNAVIAAAQRLWPTKTAAHLSSATGFSMRTCEYWLSRKTETEMSSEALAKLLRSEGGLEILEAIIGDAKPTWWKQFARTIELSRLRKQQEDARLRLVALELSL